MKDFYPSDLRKVRWIEELIGDIANLYDYEEFESPLMESIDIFAAKSSEELVNEQSFIVEKKKGTRLILRPELTPSLARMVARKSQELKRPIRWYSNPVCFRYERPQRGRMRSFQQVNFDILDETSLYAELEMFQILIDILTSFGATSKQFQIYYNNRRLVDAVCKIMLGIPEKDLSKVYKVIDKSEKMNEQEFKDFLKESFKDARICDGIVKLKGVNNLDELVQCFENVPQEFYESIGYKEITELENLIRDNEIVSYCSLNFSVVRGLDYYTGTVFELFDTGSKNIRSICGGGRYDDLLSLFSNEKITGVGFGMGVLMLSLFLETYGLIPDYIGEKDYTDTIYIASINEKVSSYAIKISKLLREEDLPCIVDYRFNNLKNQLSKAGDIGVLITLILGPKEMELNKVTVKNMKTEEQKIVNLEDLVDEIFEIIDYFGDTEE
ncbi:MAG: histidine--tRNA ligase [Candidatus Lokiarchaeota archaeon]|nr:histidine--tRNA ligase [Candidatus Lokiarchaeota archaeon]